MIKIRIPAGTQVWFPTPMEQIEAAARQGHMIMNMHPEWIKRGMTVKVRSIETGFSLDGTGMNRALHFKAKGGVPCMISDVEACMARRLA
jgi:hypothetical protein